MKTVKAIVINPYEKAFTEINLELNNDYGATSLNKLIGNIFTRIRLINGDSLWLDDEGLLKPNAYFLHKDYPDVLAGFGIITGTDGPDISDAKTTIEELENDVSFKQRSSN